MPCLNVRNNSTEPGSILLSNGEPIIQMFLVLEAFQALTAARATLRLKPSSILSGADLDLEVLAGFTEGTGEGF